MSEIKVNKISPRAACGTTQLGDSGDTFTVPSGAAITIASGATINNNGTANNFGATGAVNWQTTVKSANFTAVNGEGYFVDTSSGAISVNLPAGSAGAVVGFKDYAKTFDTNKLTLVQNGSDKIGGSAINATISTEGVAITLVFIDSTQGWLVTDSGLQSDAPTSQYIAATGGTITTSGDYKIHTFTGPGTFTVCTAATSASNNIVDYVVVAGGGGGGALSGNSSGGGGGGGFRFYANTTTNPQTCAPAAPINNFPSGTAITVAEQGYPITVGGGSPATPFPTSNPGGAGSNSIFSTITSAGGGGGGMAGGGGADGNPGGSGGGGTGGAYNKAGGTGNTPPTSPSQGNNGGTSPTSAPPDGHAGGGGGAMAVGGSANVNGAGPGGAGGGVKGFGASGEVSSCISYFSGGGGGGSNGPGGYGKAGGIGGGGASGPGDDTSGIAGTVNTGGGGGGFSAAPDGSDGSAGGSGIVIIRYRFQ